MTNNFNLCMSETIISDSCSGDVRADIVVNNAAFRIWGRVTNRCGFPVSGAGVMLLRRTGSDSSCFELVAETVSDSDGMYSFDVEDSAGCECYKVTART